MHKLLITLILVFSYFTNIQAKTYYVSIQGNDENDGLSPETAWRSLDKVSVTVFQQGDTLLFKSGDVWTGGVAPKGSGSKVSPIVVDKYGAGANPRIDGQGQNDSRVFALTDQSYWKIVNLEITNRQPQGGENRLTGIYVHASKDKSIAGITISHCFVHDVGSVSDEKNKNFSKGCGGIIFSGLTNDVLIEYCHVKDVSVEGIRNSSDIKCAHFVIDHNLIENVYGDGIVLHGVKRGSAITHNTLRNTCYNTSKANYAGAWTYLSDSTRIAYNEVSGITGGGHNDGQPFDADIAVNGDIFEYNYTHDNAKGFMLFMPSAKNVIVRFNLSVNDISNGSGNQRLFNYTVRKTGNNNKIYNNTFFIDAKVDYLFQGGFVGTFTNNIVYCLDSVDSFANKPLTEKGEFFNNCFYPLSITSINGPAGKPDKNLSLPCLKIHRSIGTPKIIAQRLYALPRKSPLKNKGKGVPDNGGRDFTGKDISANNVSAIGAIW